MNRYFYIDIDGKQKGTFSPDELRQEHVKRDTLVWTQGMEQWKRAGDVDELLFLFSEEPGNYQTASSSQPSQYPQSSAPLKQNPVHRCPNLAGGIYPGDLSRRYFCGCF